MNKLVVQFYLETTSPVRSSELGLRFKLYDGVERVINNVRLVPDLKRNLISLSEFDKKGYVFKGENEVLKVLKGSMIFMKGMQKNGLHSLMGEVVMGSAHDR